MCSASTWTRAGSPTPGGRARPANGPSRRPGFPVSRRGASAIAIPHPDVPAGPQPRAAARAARRRAIIGRRGPNSPAAPAGGRIVAQGRRKHPRELLRADRARKPRHGHEAAGGSATPASIRRSTNCRTSSARSSWRKIGEPGTGRGDASAPGQDRAADRTSHADPARKETRPSSGAAVARQQRSARGPVRCDRSLSQSALERRSTAGASIPHSPSGTSCRNRPSAAPRSARAGAVGLMQVLPVTAQMISRNRGMPYPRPLTDPQIQSRIWPELHRDDAAAVPARRASCRG